MHDDVNIMQRNADARSSALLYDSAQSAEETEDIVPWDIGWRGCLEDAPQGSALPIVHRPPQPAGGGWCVPAAPPWLYRRDGWAGRACVDGPVASSRSVMVRLLDWWLMVCVEPAIAGLVAGAARWRRVHYGYRGMMDVEYVRAGAWPRARCGRVSYAQGGRAGMAAADRLCRPQRRAGCRDHTAVSVRALGLSASHSLGLACRGQDMRQTWPAAALPARGAYCF